MTRMSITLLFAVPLLGACPSAPPDPPAKAEAPAAPAAKPGAPVGSAAPDFDVADDAGKRVTMAQHRGKQPVLLAFYPKDFTGG
jgi:hypothetical protein